MFAISEALQCRRNYTTKITRSHRFAICPQKALTTSQGSNWMPTWHSTSLCWGDTSSIHKRGCRQPQFGHSIHKPSYVQTAYGVDETASSRASNRPSHSSEVVSASLFEPGSARSFLRVGVCFCVCVCVSVCVCVCVCVCLCVFGCFFSSLCSVWLLHSFFSTCSQRLASCYILSNLQGMRAVALLSLQAGKHGCKRASHAQARSTKCRFYGQANYYGRQRCAC